MTQVLAAEGGYQAFTLSGSEWAWLVFAGVVAIVALLLGVVLMRGVLAEEQGTDKMQEIAGAIQEGALAYLRRQFRTIGIIVRSIRPSRMFDSAACTTSALTILIAVICSFMRLLPSGRRWRRQWPR